MELVINAKERRKFIIIQRGFLSKLNRSINIRVELIDRLKKKLSEKYSCDGDSKVCEINIIHIGLIHVKDAFGEVFGKCIIGSNYNFF